MPTRIGYHRDQEELEAGRLEDRGKKEREGPEEESTEGEGNRGTEERRRIGRSRRTDNRILGRRHTHRQAKTMRCVIT